MCIHIISKIRISNVDEVLKLDLKVKCNPELHGRKIKFFLKKKDVMLLSLEDIKDVDEL